MPVNRHIFREYDIRGVAGPDLNAESVAVIARAIASYFVQKGARRIAIGFDARESSPEFKEILIAGLNETGCDTVEIGRVTTPMLYYAVFNCDVGGGVMITGSHNPPDHNGFKICLGKEALHSTQIKEIGAIVETGEFAYGSGQNSAINIIEDYKHSIVNGIHTGGRKLKLVVDAGNGMGGTTAVPVYRKLGHEVIDLFCDPDSSFPNHPPDPSQEENLQDLIKAVKDHKADLGIAFDGDGDRITVVDDTGRVIWGDELLTLFVPEVLEAKPGGSIVAEVKCTQRLFDQIEQLGGVAIMSKAGHSIIKARMRETDAILGGEMSGHIFFRDRHQGYDDAAYAGARVLEILSKTDKPLSAHFADLPRTFSTPEIRIPCPEERKQTVIDNLIETFGKDHKINTVDGVRIKFAHGWGLVRPSNTQALLILRFEADSADNLTGIRDEITSKTRLYID